MASDGNLVGPLIESEERRVRRNSDTALGYNSQTQTIQPWSHTMESLTTVVVPEGQPALSPLDGLERIPRDGALGGSPAAQQWQRGVWNTAGGRVAWEERDLPLWRPPPVRRLTFFGKLYGCKHWVATQLSSQIMAHLGFANYFVMLYSSIATLVAGKAAESRASWDMIFLLSYVIWGISASAALLIDFKNSASPITNAVSHLGCCAAIIYFFSSVLHVAPVNLPYLVPICINFGLLASIGLQRISPDLKNRILGYVAGCLGMQYNSTHVEVVLNPAGNSVIDASPA